jgi:HK97 family phage major capsid protein
MPESAIAWTEYSLAMEKILDSIPVTHEMLTDVAWAEAEIRNFLDVNMMLAEESQIVNGNGTAPNFEGLYAVYATEYTQAMGEAFATAMGGVDDANLFDLIRAVTTQIQSGFKSKYRVNYVLMNDVDYDRMRLAKDTTSQYLRFPELGGIEIITSSLITANTMLVGDRNFSRYYRQEGFTLELGYNTGDFAYDRISLKARKRGNVLVRNVDSGSLYKVTDINTRLTDITA